MACHGSSVPLDIRVGFFRRRLFSLLLILELPTRSYCLVLCIAINLSSPTNTYNADPTRHYCIADHTTRCLPQHTHHKTHHHDHRLHTSRYIDDSDLIFVPRVTFRVSTAPGSLHRLLWSAQLAVGYAMKASPIRYTFNSATPFAEDARDRICIFAVKCHASKVRPDRGDICDVIDVR